MLAATMLRILALFVLLCACAVPVPICVRDGTTIGHDMETLPEVVEDACAMLGIACEASDREYGSVELDLIKVDTEAEMEHARHALVVHGRTDDAPCSPKSWADPSEMRYVAHELGHVFGLEHVQHDYNFMDDRGRGGYEITDDQLDTVAHFANLFVNCR